METVLRKNSYATTKHNKGFTLIEALVVLAIAGILIGFGVPQFQLVIKNNRLVTTTNEIIGAFNYARIEAVKRGNTVHLGANSGDPNIGWLAWIDNGSTANVFDSGDEELRIWESVPQGVTITVTPSTTAFVFDSSGTLSGGAATTFAICDDRTGESGSTISLLVSGVVSRTDLTCG